MPCVFDGTVDGGACTPEANGDTLGFMGTGALAGDAVSAEGVKVGCTLLMDGTS